MLYKKLFFIPLLSLFLLQLSATPCEHPIVASDDFAKKFRYGCFCGKGYPNIEHTSKKSYRDLNRSQRKELILQYKNIDAYDDIDEVCKEHDICYIYYGRKAKICNDRAFNRFNTIKKIFYEASENNISNKQCSNLAYDMGSIFYTIFMPSDDENTIFDFGMLMFNGAITATNKVLQESADTLYSDVSRYPRVGKRCNIKSLLTIKKIKQ